jgi:hypothetical protein
MSSCMCEERTRPVAERKWVVYMRNCHRSAFSGGRKTWSRHSAVCCKACGAHWRTTAAYVQHLRSGAP